MRLDDDTDQVGQHDRDHVVQRELGGARPDDLEERVGQLVVHHLESALVSTGIQIGTLGERTQPDRDQHHRESDDAQALDQVGEVGRGQPAGDAVDHHHHGDQRDQHELQFQLLAKDGHFLSVLDGHLGLLGRGLLVCDRRRGRRRQDHRLGRLGDGREEHRAVDHEEEDAEDAVGRPQPSRFVSLDIPVPQGQVPHPPVPDPGDPVKRRHEQPEHDAPHAAHSAGERRAAGVDRIAGTGAGTKCGKRLQQLPERPPAQEVVLLLVDPRRAVRADADHHHEVAAQNEVVGECHCGEFLGEAAGGGANREGALPGVMAAR